MTVRRAITRRRTPAPQGARRRRPAWRRGLSATAVAAALAVGGVALASCAGGPSSYTVTAMLPSAEGLFPGNAVDLLGVGVGNVTGVAPGASRVIVTMSIKGSQSLPAGVHAALTTPQLLGEPSIELSPGYTGGPRLAPGAVIPESRTSVPISTDQLLRDLQQYLGQVNAPSFGGLINNLAQDLQGQGQSLNQLIARGATTLNVLAQKGNDLGQLEGSLAQITGTLKQRTSTVAQLLQSYATVAHVVAQNSGPLGDSITQLANASQQLAALLNPNLQPLQTDIGTITQVGRTLDRNLSSLDQGLSSSVQLFSAAGRAYDPTHNWLNLNNQMAPGLTGNVMAGLIRDRLAGVCRRVLANHAAGLSPTQVQTLQSCGNPNSGYFDQLLSVIPQVLGNVSGGSISSNGSQGTAGTQSGAASGTTPQQVLSQGLNQIPGLTPSQRSTLSQLPPSMLSTPQTHAPQSSSADVATRVASITDQQANQGGGGAFGGLLSALGAVAHFFGSLL